MSEQAKCELCGDPMPPGEEMFKYHGYSGNCPKPPLRKQQPPADAVLALAYEVRDRYRDHPEWDNDTDTVEMAQTLARRVIADAEQLKDADLLLGVGWQEAVRQVQGQGSDKLGALSIQCTKLAGDVAVLQDDLSSANKRLVCLDALAKRATRIDAIAEESAMTAPDWDFLWSLIADVAKEATP